MSDGKTSERTYYALLVGLAFFYLHPLVLQPSGIAFYPDAAFSDLLITHLPNASFIRASLSQWGQIPLWNPMLLSGTPFAADPLSGLWYPPLWLVQLLPALPAFNLLFLLHLILSGWGVYRLLREDGSGPWGALLAGAAWMGASKWSAHIALGHVTLCMAVAWTPWLLLVAGRICNDASCQWRWSAVGGVLLGIIMLADPRWVVTAGLLAAAVALRACRRHGVGWRTISLAGGTAAIIAFLVSAPVSLPLLEFIPLSTRASLSAAQQSYLSLPWAGLLDLLLPLARQPEWSTYVGGAVLLLAALGAIGDVRRHGFWLGVISLALVLALGDQTPLYPLLSAIPGLNLLRVPPRMLFVCALGVAILAGWGVDSVMRGVQDRALYWGRLLTAGGGVLILLLGSLLLFISEEFAKETILISLFFTVVAVIWCFLSLGGRLKGRFAALILLLLVALDLGLAGARQLSMRPGSDALTEREALAEALVTELGSDGLERVFSPSYSLPQQTAAVYGLQLADGVSPMQLQAYIQALSAATGIAMDAYAVTVPAFPAGDPRQPRELHLEAELLGQLNIGWVLSDYKLESETLNLVRQLGDVWMYRVPNVRPRAWVEAGDADEHWRAVEAMDWSPNIITITATGPGRLVLSEMVYPGWRVDLDGDPVDLYHADRPLRQLTLPEGTHTVRFRFQPLAVYAGAGLLLVGLSAAVWLWRRR